MDYERQREAIQVAAGGETGGELDEPQTQTSFTAHPPFPPIAGDRAMPPTSASDLAFNKRDGAAGEDRTLAHRDEHKDAPGAAANPYLDVAPKPVVGAPPIANPQEATRRQAGFNQLALTHTREAGAPTNVELPASLDTALDGAWRDSLATKDEQEQGGNLVRTGGGEYEFRRGHEHTGSSFTPDFNDVGFRQTLVGIAHTHPYRDEKAKHEMSSDWATFSGEDIANMVNEEQPLKILRSGPYTYMISRTKEFDALVEKAGLDDNAKSPLYQPIVDTFQAGYDAHDGPEADKIEAGVVAACETYHLVYYEGSGRELHRRTTPQTPHA